MSALRSPNKRCGCPRLTLTAACGLALISAAGEARADDQQKAEELFERGRKLMQSATTLDEACRTLAESLKHMDRGDTVLNLAECHRRQGKTATAWAEFDRALSHGSKVGFPEAIQAATQLRNKLATKLSRLTVTIPAPTAALADLTVEVGGNPWPRERWNTASVIDPGPVQITAKARGYKPFEVGVEIGAEKDAKTVVVVLEVEPPPPPPLAPPPPPAPIPKPARPLWPWIVGGAGVALGAAAIGAEIVAVGAHDELDKKCGQARQSCPRGHDFGPARTRELLGFGLFVGLGTTGVLALGAAGLRLGLSSPAQTRGPTLVFSPTTIAVQSTF
ncbi:MAG: tetratricopeptide repeat protein [Byssovorax sp.]